ncbi:hypothetical protein K9M41_04190, partial [Candidatus Gracilibacteria bacterium]|nr:hypothetical protein [Candidatus Gracilibacteria bacterium]
TLENKNLPNNQQEVSDLLDTVSVLIKVFEYQRDEADSATIKKGKQRRIDELDMAEEGLKYLFNRLITTQSQDDLLTFCDQEEKFLQTSEQRNPNASVRRIEQIQKEQDNLQAAITFIVDQRNNSSLEWGNRMLEIYKAKEKQSAKKEEAKQLRDDVDQADKLSEDILIKSIRGARGMIHMSIPAEYSPRHSSGFQTLQDDDWYYRRMVDPDIMDYMEENKCPEVCKLGIIKKREYTTREVAPAKKGILGMGKKEAKTERIAGEIKIQKFSDFFPNSNNHEDAYELSYLVDCRGPHLGGLKIQYQDYSGRAGQLMMMHIIMPASLAKKVGDKMKKDPKFIRTIAEDQMRKYFERNDREDNFQEAWDNGDKATHGIPLRPPYKEWEKEGAKFSFSEEEVRMS